MTAAALDGAVALAGFDRSGMLEAIASLPAQLRGGWARTRGLTPPGPPPRGAPAPARGPLRGVAGGADRPHLPFPGRGQPRASVGYSLVLLAGLLERAGYVALSDAEGEAAARAAGGAGGGAMRAAPTA